MPAYKTSIITLWRRGISRGIVTVCRERDWKSAVSLLVGVLLLVQFLGVGTLALEGLEARLETQTDLRLELLQSATNQDVLTFISTLRAEPYVASLSYITKEQAYSQMKLEDPEMIAFLEEFNLANPFPETVALSLNELQNYSQLVAFLSEDRWGTTVDPLFLSEVTNQESRIYELQLLIGAGRSVAIVVLVFIVAILLFVVMQLVRTRVQRRAEEITVEHLTGAYRFSIVLPFIVESITILLFAAVLSIALAVGILYVLPFIVPTLLYGTFADIVDQTSKLLLTRLPLFLGVQLGALVLMGWLGASFGVGPSLKPQPLSFTRR